MDDILLPGPTLYPLLTSIFVRFRQHVIGMSSDISKMFREVGLHTEERDLHCYLTCSKETRQLEDWRMTCLTFRVTSSPFLATQVLRQVADDYYTEFQQAAEFICRNFYVDDCLTGVSSLQEATVIRESLNQLLGKACMTHQKWRSNSRDLLATVPDDLKEKENIQLKGISQSSGSSLAYRGRHSPCSYAISSTRRPAYQASSGV